MRGCADNAKTTHNIRVSTAQIFTMNLLPTIKGHFSNHKYYSNTNHQAKIICSHYSNHKYLLPTSDPQILKIKIISNHNISFQTTIFVFYVRFTNLYEQIYPKPQAFISRTTIIVLFGPSIKLHFITNPYNQINLNPNIFIVPTINFHFPNYKYCFWCLIHGS